MISDGTYFYCIFFYFSLVMPSYFSEFLFKSFLCQILEIAPQELFMHSRCYLCGYNSDHIFMNSASHVEPCTCAYSTHVPTCKLFLKIKFLLLVLFHSLCCYWVCTSCLPRMGFIVFCITEEVGWLYRNGNHIC